MVQAADCSVELRGLRFHYRQWRDHRLDPPAFVLVHGLGSSSHIWDLVAPRLAEHHPVFALDQRGHGETQQPEDGYDFETVTQDLRAFVRAVAGSRTLLMGHSWGANVALEYAARFPEGVEGLALVDGGIASPGERWTWDETVQHLTPPDIDGMRLDDLRRRWHVAEAAERDAQMEGMFRSLFDVDEQGRVYRRFRIPNHMKVVRAIWEQRPAELLGRVRAPVLVLPARQSDDPSDFAEAKAVAAERALSMGRQVRVRWFDDTIHDVPLQKPDELAAEVLQLAAAVGVPPEAAQ